MLIACRSTKYTPAVLIRSVIYKGNPVAGHLREESEASNIADEAQLNFHR